MAALISCMNFTVSGKKMTITNKISTNHGRPYKLELTIAAEHVCGLKVLTKTVALLL